jgi:hypothetical protein
MIPISLFLENLRFALVLLDEALRIIYPHFYLRLSSAENYSERVAWRTEIIF